MKPQVVGNCGVFSPAMAFSGRTERRSRFEKMKIGNDKAVAGPWSIDSAGTTPSCYRTSAVIRLAATLVGATVWDSMVAVTIDIRTPSLVADSMAPGNVNIGASKQGTADTTLGRIQAIVSSAEAQSLCLDLQPARLQWTIDDLSAHHSNGHGGKMRARAGPLSSPIQRRTDH